MVRRPWAAHVDMYRKIPTDLMEGSRRGSILSYLALVIMVFLFIFETKAYLTTKLVTDLALDKSTDPRIRLNFNITMMDLKCEWAVIDVVSVYGTDQNVTAHVTKWNIDGSGVRQGYKGRNRNQKDIDLFDETVTESLEELHENGEDAISLDGESLEMFRNEHDYLFVDFYASWCSHCRDLAPTWEALAEVMVDASQHAGKIHPDDYSDADYEAAKHVAMPVVIAKLDCVMHPTVCNVEQNIRGYPTLRLFVDGERWKMGDYQGHRTIIDMVDWLYYAEEQHKSLMNNDGSEGERVRTLHTAHEAARQRLHDQAKTDEEKRWQDIHLNNKRRLYHEWNDDEHPGCQLSGHLLLDRTPGNFHILARSNQHDLAPHMTNVSHQVNSLSIGDPVAAYKIENGEAQVPPEVLAKISPMNGNVYETMQLHESYHHYLKVIATKAEGLTQGKRELRAYQIIPNSQLAYYRTDMVPEAKFSYDLSPIAVTYRRTSRHWYDYCTSIMAIIGGVFTVVGMIESSITATVATVKKQQQLRKQRAL